MRFPLFAIIGLTASICAAPAASGPWTEPPGGGLVGISNGPDPDGPTGLRRDVYLAFGLEEGLTVGANLTQRREVFGEGFRGRAETFVRRRIWTDGRGGVASVQAAFGSGIGGADAPDAEARLLVGRGYATAFGDGWSEAALGWRVETGAGADRLTASAATGLRPAPGWMAMTGAEADLEADRSGRGWEVLRLTGAVAREAGPGMQVFLRAEAPVWGRRAAEGVDVRLGLWRAF